MIHSSLRITVTLHSGDGPNSFYSYGRWSRIEIGKLLISKYSSGTSQYHPYFFSPCSLLFSPLH